MKEIMTTNPITNNNTRQDSLAALSLLPVREREWKRYQAGADIKMWSVKGNEDRSRTGNNQKRKAISKE